MRALLLIWVFCGFLVPVSANLMPHDFHVCITQIDHRPGKNVLEFTFKIFTDDLENTLQALGAPRLHIGDKQLEHPATDSIITAYIQNRVHLNRSADGEGPQLRWVGKEVELDATWCYLECELSTSAKEFTLENRILFERFEDQLNLIHFQSGSNKQSFRIEPESPPLVINW